MKRISANIQRGFTVLDMLVVVFILGILALIILPQIPSHTSEAKLAKLDSTLTTMRMAIRLYKRDHFRYPGKLCSGNGHTCPNSEPASGLVNSAQAFIDQLTLYTNDAGLACTEKGGDFKYGPYLQVAELPANPHTGSNGLEISMTTQLGMQASFSDLTGGWKFSVWTGEFIANDTAYDHR
ncbi:MAG: prepilin-type N-terminal cleavage/methylation domain-containing protein [Deltaproteobacteria bacterium]|nr:MAG: prepilin-type N-terminal cleavage/methylation domain-containing protein [Deltaproteobacteria bacterium]